VISQIVLPAFPAENKPRFAPEAITFGMRLRREGIVAQLSGRAPCFSSLASGRRFILLTAV
jgi:hypothetical protein